MKKYISILFAASALLTAGCSQVDLSGGMSEFEDDANVVADGVTHMTLSRILQKDPNNTAGLEIQAEFPDYFGGFIMDIYRESGKVTAVEIKENMPFEIYPLGTPEGKVAAYLDDSISPWVIRQKSNDQVLASIAVGKFYYRFQLGCQEVSYELYFTKDTE